MSLFTKNSTEFETAYYYPFEGNRIKKHAIGVAIVNEREKRFNTLVQGLVVDDDSTVLKTSYAYDFVISREIYYRNKWWVIRNTTIATTELNPQALAYTNYLSNAMRYIDIIEVE